MELAWCYDEDAMHIESVRYEMSRQNDIIHTEKLGITDKALIIGLVLVLLFPFNIFSATLSSQNTAPSILPSAISVAEYLEEEPSDQEEDRPDAVAADSVSTHEPDLSAFPDTMWISYPRGERVEIVGDSVELTADSVKFIPEGAVPVDPDYVVRDFNPDPKRAVWLSALFPGLGQLYNRRYWKLPLVVGGFMGLAYGMSWNNQMLGDYTQAYRDLMDNDPGTNSYMDFYPPGTDESSLNRSWMEKIFKSRKDYYRRNRDLCVICMIGVYLIAMVDAYVDASLTHFDVSPELSIDVSPTLIPDTRNAFPGVGLQWAFNF
ncbi:MAG: DUF5683 domain-containing protein [Muribaculum sp.]|nr:DUF5683 domain-containing protein [Muribaculum sp.]